MRAHALYPAYTGAARDPSPPNEHGDAPSPVGPGTGGARITAAAREEDPRLPRSTPRILVIEGDTAASGVVTCARLLATGHGGPHASPGSTAGTARGPSPSNEHGNPPNPVGPGVGAARVAAAVCTCPVRAHGPVRWTEGPQPRSPGAWRGGGRPGLIAHGPRGRRRQRATTASRAGTSRSGARRCLIAGANHISHGRGGGYRRFSGAPGGASAPGWYCPGQPPAEGTAVGEEEVADVRLVGTTAVWIVTRTLQRWSSSCHPCGLWR